MKRGALLACAAALLSLLVAAPLYGRALRSNPSGTLIGAISLSPQAVTLSNPTRDGPSMSAQQFTVSLAVTNAAGQAITSGTFAEPIAIRVYGPKPAAGAPALLSAATTRIDSPTPTISFTYSGGYVANPIIVTAVSGHAFAEMSFQPAHRGFASIVSRFFPMPDTARNMAAGFSFKASIGGGPPHDVELDTGSLGLVVPASALGPDAIGPGPSGSQAYTSDGYQFLGNYYLARVKLTIGEKQVTTVPIRVLAVNRSACLKSYPNCHLPPAPPPSLGVMGVGFARGMTSPMPPELASVFLSLEDVIQGSMHPGYMITPTGVTLGITAHDQTGFNYVSLTPGGTGPGDWNTAPGCFSMPDLAGYGRQCGTVLVDTGIASAILGLAQSQRPPSIATSIPQGERINFDIASAPAATPILTYPFSVGDGGPMTPTSIRWAAGSAPFVNTGRRPLSRYAYMFDDAAGKVGFKLTSPLPEPIAAPTIAGTAQQNQTLGEQHGTWLGSPTSYTYQWSDCDSAGANCTAISGASAQSYTLGSFDVGHTIRVQETAANSFGASAPVLSAATGVVVAGGAPVSSASTEAVAPTVSPTSVTLLGAIGTGASSALWQFQFGRSSDYDNATPVQTLSPASGAQQVSWNLSGLVPGATYHYRLIAMFSSSGHETVTSYGSDLTFTTLPTGKLSLSAVKLKLSGSFVKVPLDCASQLPCDGRFSITTRARLGAGPATGSVLCDTTFATVGADQQALVRAPIYPACLSLLRTSPRHRILAQFTSRLRTGQLGVIKAIVLTL
jgi:hypothetical protein